MPFSRPTLQEITARIAADIEAQSTGLQVRYSPAAILGEVEAREMHILYGWQDFLSRQYFPKTAEREYLERLASWWGIYRSPSTPATGEVLFKGPIGAVVPAATVLQRPDGIEYTTIADTIFATETQAINVVASANGKASNAAAGVQLSMVSPIAGVQTIATVGPAGIGGGTEEENDAALAARLEHRVQQPPQGGSMGDYVAWGLAFPGVTRVWVYPGELGLGTVTLRFMMDGTYDDGIPQPEDVAALQAYIDLLRPVTADVTVVAPVPVPEVFEITVTPDTPAVRLAVENQLRDLIQRDAVPGGTILISRVRESVSLAGGESDNVIIAPVANIVRATGEITTYGGVTWPT